MSLLKQRHPDLDMSKADDRSEYLARELRVTAANMEVATLDGFEGLAEQFDGWRQELSARFIALPDVRLGEELARCEIAMLAIRELVKRARRAQQ